MIASPEIADARAQALAAERVTSTAQAPGIDPSYPAHEQEALLLVELLRSSRLSLLYAAAQATVSFRLPSGPRGSSSPFPIGAAAPRPALRNGAERSSSTLTAGASRPWPRCAKPSTKRWRRIRPTACRPTRA
jgi:hypothetical protein